MGTRGRILVTGAAGGVGQVSCAGLRARGWQVVGFDRVADPGGCDRYVEGELVDRQRLAVAIDGCDAVLHLAANPSTHADFLTRLVEPNIIGLWRVLELAAERRLRTILASSINTANGRRSDPPSSRSAELIDPGNPYGLTKVFLEDAARFFHLQQGLQVVCARIGTFPRNPVAVTALEDSPDREHYLSHHDWLRFLDAALRSETGFAVAYAISRPRDEYWPYDPEAGRRLLGYEPQDRWPEGLPDPAPADHPALQRPRRRWYYDDAMTPAGPWQGDRRQVLITGAAGAIGRHLGPALRAAGWRVIGLDRASDPGGFDAFHQADLCDRAAVDRALAGCGALVHLAAVPRSNASFDEVLDPNIRGLWTVLEAALAAGLPRTVLASSINACNGPIARAGAPVGTGLCDPGNVYGLSKVFAERAGRLFHRHCGLSVVALRLGWFPRDAEEVRRIVEHGHHNVYLSHDDCVRHVQAALETPDIGFALAYALSRPDPQPPRWDSSATPQLLGVAARDRWPEGMPLALQQAARAAAATPAEHGSGR